MPQQFIQQIPLNKIISGKQVRERFDEESLTGLTESMRESGQQEPIHVLPLDGDMYSLLTGGRRLRAARKAGWTNVAAIVEEGELSKGDILVRQIIENAQREDLTPWEKAKAIESLMKETGWNSSQTARKLGFVPATITKHLAVLSVPESIQRQIQAGEIPATAAYELAQVKNPSEQEQLAQRVANGELTRDGLSDAVKAQKRKSPAKRNAYPRACRVTAKLENRQSVMVRAPSLDLNSFVAILETLLGHARDAHTQGLTLGAFVKRMESIRHTPAPIREAG